MTCPVCGFINASGTAQCAACGTQLIAAPKPLARAGDAVCATHKDTPALQPCGRCGTFYCGACLERSADGQMYCVACRTRGTLPWDRRAELGLLRAWWQTSTKLLYEPTVTLSGAAREGSIASSLVFTMISSVAGFITTLGVYVFVFGSVAVAALAQARDIGETGPKVGIGIIGLAFAFVFIFGFATGFQVTLLFVLSGIEHLVLRLMGERQLGSYNVTVRAHALGMAPYVIGLLPFCGTMVMGLWSLVVRCMTLMHLQKVSAGKAVVAVLAPMVVLCGCMGGLYLMLLAAVFSAAGLAAQH